VEKAEKLKADANELFKNEKFGAAIELYSQAILLCPSNAVYYANRSIANHRMENFGNFKLKKEEVIFVS
jgi:serine/threonine-protein phosphatase 5